jgi:hypothetical protein
VSLIDPLKFLGGPGFLFGIVLAFALGVIVARRSRRYRLVAWIWAAVVSSLTIVLALPVVAQAIASRLPPAPNDDRPCVGRFETLIVFDGDNRRGRLAEALHLWHRDSPRLIIVSGGEWLVEELVAAGVPQRAVHQDDSASTTREQVEWLGGFRAVGDACDVRVVASELQMPRVAALVRMQRLPVSLHAAPVDSPVPTGRFRQFIPSYAALRVSRDALYELAAIHHYRREGWLAPDAD